MDDVSIINVGTNYVNPVITIGTGNKKRQIGTFTTDSQGRLTKPNITEAVLGFIKPVVEDKAATPTGTGAQLSVVYTYTSPREIRENNVLPLTQYIDCVGHPMIQSAIEEEQTGLTDTGFNLVDSQTDTTTTSSSDTTTVSTPTTADPVSTPVNQDTTQPSAPSTPSTPTPPSTPPAQNNPPQQGGYGGY